LGMVRLESFEHDSEKRGSAYRLDTRKHMLSQSYTLRGAK